MKRILVLVCAALAVFFARDLSAQQPEPPTIQASAQPRDVEVGEPFSISLSVSADADGPSPTDPRIAVTEGLRTGPPSVSSQTQITIVNGRMSRRSGFDATWQSRPREGLRRDAERDVERKEAAGHGAAHHRSRGDARRAAAPAGPQQAPNPFDPGIPQAARYLRRSAQPSADRTRRSRCRPDAPLDPNVFRAVVDKKTAVVGQQITSPFTTTREPWRFSCPT
jgi:hypothetical protein